MNTLTIKELTRFRDDLRRDVVIDGLSRPRQPTDRAFLEQVINYGNAYLERAIKEPANRGVVLWFDIYFDDPAVIGMTWAYNPNAPHDHISGMEFFWRLWTEIPPMDGAMSLTEMREAFTSYVVQR